MLERPGAQVALLSIYTVQDNGKRMTRIATGTPQAHDRRRRRSASRHAGRLPWWYFHPSAHKRRPYAFSSRKVNPSSRRPSVAVAAAAAEGWRRPRPAVAVCGSGATSPVSWTRWRRGRQRRRSARKIAPQRGLVRIDKPQEWEADVFDDAWRCMKYRFYDPKLHGTGIGTRCAPNTSPWWPTWPTAMS